MVAVDPERSSSPKKTGHSPADAGDTESSHAHVVRMEGDHCITSFARSNTDCGIVRPSALAVQPKRWFDAYRSGGSDAKFVQTGAAGANGHFLINTDVLLWSPAVAAFLDKLKP